MAHVAVHSVVVDLLMQDLQTGGRQDNARRSDDSVQREFRQFMADGPEGRCRRILRYWYKRPKLGTAVRQLLAKHEAARRRAKPRPRAAEEASEAADEAGIDRVEKYRALLEVRRHLEDYCFGMRDAFPHAEGKAKQAIVTTLDWLRRHPSASQDDIWEKQAELGSIMAEADLSQAEIDQGKAKQALVTTLDYLREHPGVDDEGLLLEARRLGEWLWGGEDVSCC